MMQDIILGRIWADHHQRIYGDVDPLPSTAAAPAKARDADPLPPIGKAMVLALAVGVASVGATVAVA